MINYNIIERTIMWIIYSDHCVLSNPKQSRSQGLSF